MSIITMERVTKTYNPGRPNEFVALHEISADIPSGQCTVLASFGGYKSSCVRNQGRF
ncbi:MAG: hypothetical protein HY912_11825 [Desulfomonile tiedjei]|uniref:Uncharacterized protein n=1 Tax=Desulfomonile tiedjei TaxID=2358 RepID=A0A9D6V3P9_9BACT|nr:hypothetical protein [Desulfomonile tiedjei]